MPRNRQNQFKSWSRIYSSMLFIVSIPKMYIIVINILIILSISRQFMSKQAYVPIQNSTRYDVNLTTYRENECVIYMITILDLAIGVKFSQIKKMHEQLLKKYKPMKDQFPQFPKTNSFCLWNRTNKDHRKIEERRRELEFYLDRLLNNPALRSLNEIKSLLINVSKLVTRAHSNLPMQVMEKKPRRVRSLPSLKQKLQYYT